jgi:hypothetical protein
MKSPCYNIVLLFWKLVLNAAYLYESGDNFIEESLFS